MGYHWDILSTIGHVWNPPSFGYPKFQWCMIKFPDALLYTWFLLILLFVISQEISPFYPYEWLAWSSSFLSQYIPSSPLILWWALDTVTPPHVAALKQPNAPCCVNVPGWSPRCESCRPCNVEENSLAKSGFKDHKMGMSENGVYSQWNSHLVGIMISKTIGCRGTLFSDKPKWLKSNFYECSAQICVENCLVSNIFPNPRRMAHRKLLQGGTTV